MQRECQPQRGVDSRDTQAIIASVFSNIRASWSHLPGAVATKGRRKLLESDNLRRVQLTTQGHARKCSLIRKSTLILVQLGVRRLPRGKVSVRKGATRVAPGRYGLRPWQGGAKNGEGGGARQPPFECREGRQNYWLSGVIPAGHSGGAGAGLTPVESDWMTPDPSEQKLRCPVVPTFTGQPMIV
jgi:hypothetical protein